MVKQDYSLIGNLTWLVCADIAFSIL